MKKIDFNNDIHNSLINGAMEIGYVPIKPIEIVEFDEGLLGIKVNHINLKRDNGIYYLRIHPDYSKTLVVETPSTISNSKINREIINQINNFISTIDMSDLNAYDFAAIFGEIITDNVTSKFAQNLFKDDPVNQMQFKDVYLPIFLSDLSKLTIANEVVNEVEVNTKPFLIKQLIQEKIEEIKNEEISRK